MITGNLVDIDVNVFEPFLAEAIPLGGELDKIHGKSGSRRQKEKYVIEYYDSMKTEKLEFSGFSAKRFLLKDLKINRMLLIKVSDLPLYVGFIFFNLHKRFRPAVCPDHSINGCKGKLQNLPETPKNAKNCQDFNWLLLVY